MLMYTQNINSLTYLLLQKQTETCPVIYINIPEIH